MKGWRKKWFYLRNGTFTPLPTFTSGCPVPLPSWGEGVAKKDLGKLHPLRKNLQQFQQDGLTGMHLLRTFFSCRIQRLRRQRTKMWTYPGPSCPNRPSSEELSAVEVEARIHKVLALGVIPTTGAGPIPLRRGIASVRISTLDPIFMAFMILSFHYACDLVQGLGGGCGEPRDADPPADAVGREARHASSEKMWAWEERDHYTTERVVKR
jgi:hypothetical protein